MQATFLIAVTPIMHAFWNLKEGSQEHLVDMCAACNTSLPVMPLPVPRCGKPHVALTPWRRKGTAGTCLAFLHDEAV